MGIDLTCGDINYHCSYSYWHTFRCNMIIATIKYIKKYYEANKENMFDYEIQHMEDLIDVFKTIETKVNETEKINGETQNSIMIYFINKCLFDENFIENLIMFDIYGLFILCNKSDSVGYYSVGNSYDIFNLFEKITPTLINNNEIANNEEIHLFNDVMEVINVFEESKNTETKVIIS